MEEVKLYARRIKNLKDNKQTLFGVVWGQYSSGLQEVIKGDDDYEVSASTFDVIWLLEKGKLVSSVIDQKSNKYLTFFQAMSAMCNIRQGPNESNDSYRKRVDSAALTLSLVGGKNVFYSEEISDALDPEKPGKEEICAEEEKLKAMIMIIRSDPGRYASLQESLIEDMYKGRDEFPQTKTAAYDLLQHINNDILQEISARQKNSNKSSSWFRRNKRSTNVSFTQKGEKCEIVPGTDGKVHADIQCHNCNLYGHYSNQCHHKKKVLLAHFTLAQKNL